jgi:hypothetical protein
LAGIGKQEPVVAGDGGRYDGGVGVEAGDAEVGRELRCGDLVPVWGGRRRRRLLVR